VRSPPLLRASELPPPSPARVTSAADPLNSRLERLGEEGGRQRPFVLVGGARAVGDDEGEEAPPLAPTPPSRSNQERVAP
jgi:hypothetical protein